ncbi:MAG: HAD-IIIA family hydrolase [Gammaproteobacteria bacterium]|nr:HAD-IIIA family hydrolase [Gammaproteobacteria bacterium]
MLADDLLDKRLSGIEVLVLDVDGVLSDGRLTFDANGLEYKSFHVHDGYGLKKLQTAGIKLAIVTGRSSPIVTNRAKELAIKHVIQAADNKLAGFEEVLERVRVLPANAAYVGDDEPDLPAMRSAGVAIAVANAVGTVREQADWVTLRNGGEGAVREICERILAARS